MMSKKMFLYGALLLGCIGISINYGYAEEYTQEDFAAVSIRFCNDGTGSLSHDTSIHVEAGKKSQVCLYITNGGPKDVELEYGYSVSMNDMGRVCDGDMSTTNAFSMLIPQTQERKMIIDAGNSKMIQEDIMVHPGMSGLQLGCLLYKIGTPSSLGAMFILESRKYGYMDIVIGSEADVISDVEVLESTGEVFSTNKIIGADIDDENNLHIRFLVKNNGNITQNVTITGKIYNALGYQKDFAIDTVGVNPGTTSQIMTNVGMLPAYKGLFSVKYSMKIDPVFLFPVTNEKLKKSKYFTGKGSLFAFSWIVVIVLLIVVFILYRAFFKGRKATLVAVSNIPSPPPTV